MLKTWGPNKRHWAENFQSKRWARVRPCRIFQSLVRDRELQGRGAKPIWLTSPSAAAPSISRAALSEAGGRARPPPVAEKGRARSGSNRERRAGGLPHALHDHVATGARKEKQCHATTTLKAAPHHQMRGSTISVPQGYSASGRRLPYYGSTVSHGPRPRPNPPKAGFGHKAVSFPPLRRRLCLRPRAALRRLAPTRACGRSLCAIQRKVGAASPRRKAAHLPPRPVGAELPAYQPAGRVTPSTPEI